MEHSKPNLLYYRVAQAASWLVAKLIFRRKFLRNEIRGKKGPFLVIANHEAALDFVNLIGATALPMTFVISNSFYSTLPIKGFLDKMGVIPKQQFQTTVKDLKRIKAVIDRGESVVIYPAGLMCEDGLSTPIPAATYKLLRWLGVDVYLARITGSYFVMPKWGKGFRPGRTLLDISLLFSKEALSAIDPAQLRQQTENALAFDAYRDQEQHRIRYQGGSNLEGLEHVLYRCPHCGKEFTMEVRDRSSILCTSCGYCLVSDEYGFLHNRQGLGPELRYVSDWSLQIQESVRRDIRDGLLQELSFPCAVRLIDPVRHKFRDAGTGTLSLNADRVYLAATLNGQEKTLQVGVASLPSLPFSPGKYLELQCGNDIYRCVPEDPRVVMKCIHTLKCFHQLQQAKLTETVSV